MQLTVSIYIWLCLLKNKNFTYNIHIYIYIYSSVCSSRTQPGVTRKSQGKKAAKRPATWAGDCRESVGRCGEKTELLAREACAAQPPGRSKAKWLAGSGISTPLNFQNMCAQQNIPCSRNIFLRRKSIENKSVPQGFGGLNAVRLRSAAETRLRLTRVQQKQV